MTEKTQPWRGDTEFTDCLVGEVRVLRGGAFSVGFSWGSLFVQNERQLPAPSVGDVLRLYGRVNLGGCVRGMVDLSKGGEPVAYYYKTKNEEAVVKEERSRSLAAEKRKQWGDALPETQRRVVALPPEFQKRIMFFMENPDWGWEFGLYELFCCEQALLISNHCQEGGGSVEERIAEFTKDTEKQKEILGAGYEQHSGNTFGMACRLAAIYLVYPHMLSRAHGALCLLVGCEAYGCYASRKGEEGTPNE
jgi:hypothetical protein